MASKVDFDIVVYGSSSGAVTAAIQAAKLGRDVALVSPLKHIGGIQIEGLGSSDIDNQAEFQNSTTLGGLNLEFHRRISRHYGRIERLEEAVRKKLKDPGVWKVESCVAEKIIREWLSEFSNITIIQSPLSEQKGVEKNGATIRAITLENGTRISGKVFIEASYEGDLLAASGISTVIGRESLSTYNETLAGVRDVTPYRQIDVPIDPYNIEGDPSSGLLYGVSDEPFGKPGDGDAHLQSYSYRVPLTDVPENRVPFSKPEGYDEMKYELHRRFVRAGGEFFIPVKKVPNEKTDLIGSESALATDLLGMNDTWPTASYAERHDILKETRSFTQGLLYFFANDETVPEKYRKEWSRYGYCKDEFLDNEHFPRQLYIRDARRMLSDYIITEHTATQGSEEELPHDPIAVAFWPTDTHSVRRILRDGKVHNEGFIFKDGHRWRPFGVSYRAVVPKRAESTNLISVTCPSSSHVGYGAVRLEHQFHAIGQACANACDIALKGNISVQDVEYGELKARLIEQGIVIDATSVGAPTFD